MRHKITLILILLALLIGACTGTLPDVVTATPIPESTPTLDSTRTPQPTLTPTRTFTPRQPQRSRLSFNISGQMIQDRPYLAALLNDLNPPSVLYMDDMGLAAAYKRAHPEALVVYRGYKSCEGGCWWQASPQAFVDEAVSKEAQHGWPGVIHYLSSNEPGWNATHTLKQFLANEIEVMQLARTRGITLSIANFGIGTQQPYDIEAGVYDEFLRVLSDTGHYLSVHEYTNGILPFGVGQWPLDCLKTPATSRSACTFIDNWPTREELPITRCPASAQTADNSFGYQMMLETYRDYLTNLGGSALAYQMTAQGALGTDLCPYWHILRLAWFLVRQDYLGVSRSPVLVTEGSWDHNNDVDSVWLPLSLQYGLGDDPSCPTCFKDLRGINSLHDDFPNDGNDSYWEYIFPYWSHAETAVCQLIWLDSIYPPEVKAIHLFTWSNNIQWATFDFSGLREVYMRELHDLLRRYARREDIWNTVCIAKARSAVAA